MKLPEGFLKGFHIVVAHDSNMGIGRNGGMAWHLPEDLKRFREITGSAPVDRQSAVIMGFGTWDSIRRPLPNRFNAVVSSKRREIPEVGTYNSLDYAIRALCSWSRCGQVFVIGGGSIYEQALKHPALAGLYVTEIQGDHACDTFMAEYHALGGLKQEEATKWLTAENGMKYRFVHYSVS